MATFYNSGTYPKNNQRVKVVSLKSTRGWIIPDECIASRKTGITGIVKRYVSGHGDDVWFAQHDDGTVAAYGIDEMQPA